MWKKLKQVGNNNNIKCPYIASAHTSTCLL